MQHRLRGGVLMGMSHALFEERILDNTPAGWSIRT
jgi:CO/xanthine dehydrogenase Mo-binding subunit